MCTRKDRERWLDGRKVHGVLQNRIACRKSFSLAYGWAFNDSRDLRQITCLSCRKAIRKVTCNK